MIPLKFATSIFWDLDGVLFVTLPEAQLAYEKQNWGAYMVAQFKAPVIGSMALFARAMALDHNNIIVTARSEEYRRGTVEQLKMANIPYDTLFMRPIGNHDPSPVLKLKMLEQFAADFDVAEVSMIIEDRADVAEAFIKRGIPTLLYKGV